jgi:TolB-like protein
MDRSPQASPIGPLRVGTVAVDPARACLIDADGAPVPLRPKTWEVLAHLLRHPGRIVTRAELLDAVWPDVLVTDHNLSVCIAELRRAIGKDSGAIIRTVSRRGYLLEADAAVAPGAWDVPAPERRTTLPVLAVLPFANLSGDQRWERLCDGLVEDMITDFARHADLRVIARTSSFAWQGRAADIREIGRALGAGYLLEGSVQAEGSQVSVTAQLIDGATGAHVWARRFRRDQEGLFAIQADVVGQVVGALAGLTGAIARTELARAHRAPPASLEAYELYLLGYEQEARLDREGTLRAIALLDAAVAVDAGLSRAWTVLGLACGNAAANGWTDDINAMRARQREAILRAVALDPEDALAREELGAILAREGDLDGARTAFAQAAEAGANHADALALLGKYMVEVLGHAGMAEQMTKRAFALNPFAPAWYYLGATRVAYVAEYFAEAAEFALRAPALRMPRLFRVLALAQRNREDEARAAFTAYREQFGPDAFAQALAALPPLCPDARHLLEDGLRKADLSDIRPDGFERGSASGP